MFKILMIGDSDLLLENTYEFLSTKYRIQLCDASDTAIVRMNKITNPNLILIIKSSGVDDELLSILKRKITDTNIICICREGDPSAKKLSGDNLHFVFRPIKNSDLHNKIKELTGEALIEQSLETYDGLFVKKEKHKILAIDDSPIVLRGLKQLLNLEYDVSLATSLSAAKDQLAKNKNIELILLDYEMPDIDGVGAYRFIKSNPDTMDIPVVFLTGVSDKKRISEVASLSPKPAGYLLKPIDADMLKETIKKVFSR